MATRMLPHSTSHSPVRPVSSYSAHSTIRRVTPSPDSLSEALSQGFATHSTPRRPAHAHSSKDLGYGQRGNGEHRINEGQSAYTQEQEGPGSQHNTAKPPFEPSHTSRKITPSRIPVPSRPATTRLENTGGLKRRRAGRLSPSKPEAARQQRPMTSPTSPTPPQPLQTRPIMAAPTSQAASAGLALPMEPPRTPPAIPNDEQARLAEFTLFPTDDPFISQVPSLPPSPLDPTHPVGHHRAQPSEDFFQPPLFKHDDPDAFTPLPDSPRKPIPQLWMPPGSNANPTHQFRHSDPDAITPVTPVTPVAARGPGLPRDPSVKSWASHMTFSTPGRDEMERKRAFVKGGDEGPFESAKSMDDLAEKRRQVSEGTIVRNRVEEVDGDGDDRKKTEGEGGGLCKCCVM